MVTEVDAITYAEFIANTKIFIGWNRCPVFEHISLTRCFRCCKLGHTAKDCNGDVVCPLCSGKHERVACKSLVKKCCNCNDLKSNLNLNIDVEHTVWDRECHSFIKAKEQYRSRIQYSY